MALRFLLHIPHRAVRVILYGVLAGALLFVVLTRTQVGRDALRDEIERQFAARYDGRLEIETLRGNLLRQLFAGQVRLFDPAGNLVLSADSVIVRPSWRDLFRRTIAAPRIRLLRPELHLLRQPDGRWSIAEAFGPAAAPAEDRPRWSFTSADVTVEDGLVTTRNLGPAPAAVAGGWVFDYTRTEVLGLDARAVVELGPALKLVDVLSLRARTPDLGFDVEALRGQFVFEDGRLAANGLELRAGATSVRLSGSLDLGPDAPPRLSGATEVDLDLTDSHLDFDQLRRVVPRLPLSGDLTAALRLGGTLADLTVAHLDVARGQSRLSGQATLRGLPDSLGFEAAFAPSTLRAADVRALLPRLDLARLDALGNLRLALRADGGVDWRTTPGRPHVRVSAEGSVAAAAGTVGGELRLRRAGTGTWAYETDLTAQSLDVSPLTRDPALRSSLNGRLVARGAGTTPRGAAGTFTLALAPSRFAGRAVDTLHVDLSAAQGLIEARAWLRQSASAASADLTLDLAAAVPAYRVDARTERLDLGPLLRADSIQTRLDAVIALEGSGRTLADLGGTLDVVFDSSTVRVGGTERSLPPHRVHASLVQRGAPEPRLEVTGDALTLRLEGDVSLRPLVALARYWGTASIDAIAAEVRKPYRRVYAPAPDTLTAPFDGDPLETIFAAEESRRLGARQALEAAGLDEQTLRADVQFHRSDLLTAFWPGLPPLSTDARATATLTASADRLSLDASVTADSLHVGSLRARTLYAALGATADGPGALRDRFVSTLEARAGTLGLGEQRLDRPEVTARYAAATAQIDLTAHEPAAGTPLRLSARLDLLPDRNRLTLDDLQLAAERYAWSNAAPGIVDVYSDAVVIPDLALENRSDTTTAPQRLRMQGVLSRAPADTLYVSAESIQLRRLSDLAGLVQPVGGQLDGRIALTGVGTRPEITGTVHVATLSFDNRILGRATLTSRYVPGLPDVALDLTLQPAPEDTALVYVPGTTVLAVHEENRLRLAGTFRLPQRAGRGRAADPGALDLQLGVERADAFFFEYIFRDVLAGVEGGLSGGVAVRGSFRRPLFEGTFQLADGRLTVPRYNLRYTAAGQARVDATGIHLDDVVVSDPTGGRAVVSGGILFNDYRYFSFDLRGRLDELQIIDVLNARDLPFYGQIWASGHATVTGPVNSATLRSTDAVTTPESNVFIPLTTTAATSDVGFIVFADSTGRIPDLPRQRRRASLLQRRPAYERPFVEGLEMDLNILAPEGSTVSLVIDPLVGDVIRAVGGGRIQLQRTEGEFFTYGKLDVTSGDYLFTAGELFYRRFLIDEGTITWDGDPLDASLDLDASYRTRASLAGLDQNGCGPQSSQSSSDASTGSSRTIPLIVQLHLSGRVATPAVDLRLAVDRSDRGNLYGSGNAGVEALMNQPECAAQYATSVLLTNSFLLTTDFKSGSQLANTSNQLAFNSLSQLVASQLNRYLNQALPNLDLNFGVQGESAQDLDVTYGVALRLLDERLVIRGQGIYQNDQTGTPQRGLLDEFVVEVRLNPRVSVEVFYRREDELLGLQSNASMTGAGLSYETQFSTWERLWERLFGWLTPDREPEETTPPEPVTAGK